MSKCEIPRECRATKRVNARVGDVNNITAHSRAHARALFVERRFDMLLRAEQIIAFV